MNFYFALVFCALFWLGNFNPLSNEKNPMENDLFEGDIAGVNVDKGLANLPDASYGKWPNGIVPYVIDSNVYTQAQLDVIYSGMRLIEDQTRINARNCITFKPRTNEQTYLRIHSGSGCWSYVGKQNQVGAQLVSLAKPASSGGSSCIWKGIVAHELMHALGFVHEQSRADRDNYVKVNWQNIITDQQHNFNKYTSGVDYLGQPYDYYSIMHYEWNAFSKNGLATIESLKPGVELLNSSKKDRITDIDVNEIRAHYNCY